MADLHKTRGSLSTSVQAAGFANPLGATQRPLNAYGPCWCGSQKRWKWCHAVRQTQKPMPFGAADRRRKAFYEDGPCLHPAASPETCSSPGAIGSHTVQRRGGLFAISEQGHVYSAKRAFTELDKRQGQYDMAKVGLAGASTFPGFCNAHDTELFQPIERSTSALDHSSAFLLSFRAVAYELASKASQLAAHIDSRDYVDNGRPFDMQSAFQNFFFLQQEGMKQGMKDIQGLKALYDQSQLSQQLSNFRAFAIRFDRILPFAAAGAFMPEFDFEGSRLQTLGIGIAADILALNITTLGGVTCAVFGWFGGDDCPAGQFVKSFKSLARGQFADAVLNIGMEYLENFFCTPSWWDGLPAQVSGHLQERMVGGFAQHSPDALKQTGSLSVAYPITEILSV